MDRRGFLKLTGQAAAAVTTIALLPGVRVFAEPIIASPWRDWIVDKGDWYEVFVPAGKTLIKETFKKPVLLILGDAATFGDCSVEGFVNVATLGPRSLILGCHLDATGYASAEGKRAVLSYVKGTGLHIQSGFFKGGDIGIEFKNQQNGTVLGSFVKAQNQTLALDGSNRVVMPPFKRRLELS